MIKDDLSDNPFKPELKKQASVFDDEDINQLENFMRHRNDTDDENSTFIDLENLWNQQKPQKKGILSDYKAKQYNFTQKINVKEQPEEQSFEANQSKVQMEGNFQMLSKTLSKETLIQKLKKANIKGPMIGKKLVVVNK